jgi:hypothetical protein
MLHPKEALYDVTELRIHSDLATVQLVIVVNPSMAGFPASASPVERASLTLSKMFLLGGQTRGEHGVTIVAKYCLPISGNDLGQQSGHSLEARRMVCHR